VWVQVTVPQSVTWSLALDWHVGLVRRHWAHRRRAPGRYGIAQAVRALVLEMARDNPGWGFTRRVRRLYVPHRARHPPGAPGRDHGPSNGGVSGPAGPYLTDLGDRAHGVKFLFRDRDTKVTTAFDAVLAAAGMRIIRAPVQAPRADAIAERWVGGTTPSRAAWPSSSSRRGAAQRGAAQRGRRSRPGSRTSGLPMAAWTRPCVPHWMAAAAPGWSARSESDGAKRG
jgi:hypothetical protein